MRPRYVRAAREVRTEEAPKGAHRRRVLAVIAAIALVGLVEAGLLHLRRPAPDPPVALHVSESEEQLEVIWDRTARPLLSAERGKLVIWDGPDTRELALDQRALRHGRVVYARQTDEVKILLLLEKRGSLAAQETVQYLAAPAAGQPEAVLP